MTRAIYLVVLGAWVRQQRRALRVKATDLARALGVNPSTLTTWERGEREMGHLVFLEIQDFFLDRLRATYPDVVPVLSVPKWTNREVAR